LSVKLLSKSVVQIFFGYWWTFFYDREIFYKHFLGNAKKLIEIRYIVRPAWQGTNNEDNLDSCMQSQFLFFRNHHVNIFCKRARKILLQRKLSEELFNEFLIYFQAISLARESPSFNNVNFHIIYDFFVDDKQTYKGNLFD
jgi:hypothetical protein